MVSAKQRGAVQGLLLVLYMKSDALEGKGDSGFCKIIWPNFMYLTSGKLLQ